MTKKLRLILATVALLVSATTAVLVNQGATASAAPACIVSKPSSLVPNVANKTVTGTFTVKGAADCISPVTVMSWYADVSLPSPAFFTTQTIAHYKMMQFGPGTYSLTTKLPVCADDPNVIHSYQADIVATAAPSPILTPPGTGGFYDQTQADGSSIVVDAIATPGKICPRVVPEPPVTPPTPTPPVVTPTPPAAPTPPTTLPKTGAGSSLGLVAGVSGVAALAHSVVRRRRTAE